MQIPGFGEIAERLRRSTVRVTAGRRGHGSGVIVRPEGVIVTNAHVAAFRPIEVELWDGRHAQADLSMRDPIRDIALLRLPLADLPAAPLGDSGQLRVGELVIAVGNPLGFTGALTTGVVHAIGRLPALGAMKWIQADVQLAPGNSGGPLADARGRVVGINTMIAEGVGLAVPSNTVSRLLRGPHSSAPLGVVTRPVQMAAQARRQFGLIILEIIKNSAAEAASLMVGDILVGAEGRALDSIEDLEQVLEGFGERVVRLQFVRGDRSNIRTVAVRLGLQSVAA
ncbi:MAG TPA: trypsin-like peptidase domain-containing protein [Candidatus Cybelea sp.]|nr:trypsin-like peptidase domain-containing protein [Candidatus Cybelea sp.]